MFCPPDGLEYKWLIAFQVMPTSHEKLSSDPNRVDFLYALESDTGDAAGSYFAIEFVCRIRLCCNLCPAHIRERMPR